MEALTGTEVELPNLKAILPYIGLFTLVTINTTGAAGDGISTQHLPSLSIRRGTKFVTAPSNTLATAQNTARIFEPLNIKMDTPRNHGVIPVSPYDEEFKEKRYWRLPVLAGAVVAALLARLAYVSSQCEDIILAKRIHIGLLAKYFDTSDDASGLSGGASGGRGGGGSGGGGRQSKRKGTSDESSASAKKGRKRKGASDESSASAKKGRKKARNVVGGDGSGDCGGSSDASGKALRSSWVSSWNVEFPPGVHSQYGQSECQEVASSTFGHDTPAKSIDTDKDNFDSDTGRSEHF